MILRPLRMFARTLAWVLFALLLIDAFPAAMQRWYGVTPDEQLTRVVNLCRVVVLHGVAAYVGIRILGSRHPTNVPGYVGWLRLTPWRAGTPLPRWDVPIAMRRSICAR